MSIRAWFCRAAVLCLAIVAARPASAISIVEPLALASWRADPGVGSAGLGAAVGMASFDLVPTYEYVFRDHTSDQVLNVDGHIPVIALPLVALYVGGGYGRYWHDPDAGESKTYSGFNILVGGKASVRRLKPYFEARYSTTYHDGFVFTIGNRFHLFD